MFYLCELPRSVLTEYTVSHRKEGGIYFTEWINNLIFAAPPSHYLHFIFYTNYIFFFFANANGRVWIIYCRLIIIITTIITKNILNIVDYYMVNDVFKMSILRKNFPKKKVKIKTALITLH